MRKTAVSLPYPLHVLDPSAQSLATSSRDPYVAGPVGISATRISKLRAPRFLATRALRAGASPVSP